MKEFIESSIIPFFSNLTIGKIVIGSGFLFLVGIVYYGNHRSKIIEQKTKKQNKTEPTNEQRAHWTPQRRAEYDFLKKKYKNY